MLSAGASAVMKMAAILMKAGTFALRSHRGGGRTKMTQHMTPRLLRKQPCVSAFANHRAALNLEPMKASCGKITSQITKSSPSVFIS